MLKGYLNKVFVVIITAFLLIGALTGCTNSDANLLESSPTNSSVILATTTSTQDSGLLDVLVPIFEEQTGYMVKTIAVGTGKALSMGQEGEADVLLVHAPASEKVLVDAGDAINWQLVMHNDFVLVGPKADPAGIKRLNKVTVAFTEIALSESLFISRGDDSGTNKKELALWQDAAIEPSGKWYQETGQGMGDSLRVASEKAGYTITDRATYLALEKGLSLEILLEGDEDFFNIYHVMQVNPDKSAKINGEAGKAFVEFMISQETQEIIKEYGVEKYGQPLFFPDAIK